MIASTDSVDADFRFILLLLLLLCGQGNRTARVAPILKFYKVPTYVPMYKNTYKTYFINPKCIQ